MRSKEGEGKKREGGEIFPLSRPTPGRGTGGNDDESFATGCAFASPFGYIPWGPRPGGQNTHFSAPDNIKTRNFKKRAKKKRREGSPLRFGAAAIATKRKGGKPAQK